MSDFNPGRAPSSSRGLHHQVNARMVEHHLRQVAAKANADTRRERASNRGGDTPPSSRRSVQELTEASGVVDPDEEG